MRRPSEKVLRGLEMLASVYAAGNGHDFIGACEGDPESDKAVSDIEAAVEWIDAIPAKAKTARAYAATKRYDNKGLANDEAQREAHGGPCDVCGGDRWDCDHPESEVSK